MTPAEAARVLTTAAAFDRRTIGEFDALAWAQALADISPDDAAQAVVRHYGRTTDWLMPAHVRTGVVEIERERRRAKRIHRTALEGGYLDAEDRAWLADNPLPSKAITTTQEATEHAG